MARSLRALSVRLEWHGNNLDRLKQAARDSSRVTDGAEGMRFVIEPLDYLHSLVENIPFRSPLHRHLLQFADLIGHSDRDDFLFIPEDWDGRRNYSEHIGVSVATCFSESVLGLDWTSVAQLGLPRTRGRKVADYLANSALGPLVFEAKGTTVPSSVQSALEKGRRQKRNSREDTASYLGLVLVTCIPRSSHDGPPVLHIADPHFDPEAINAFSAGDLRGLAVAARVARYSGLGRTSGYLERSIEGKLRKLRPPSPAEEEEQVKTRMGLDLVGGFELSGPVGFAVGRLLTFPDGSQLHFGVRREALAMIEKRTPAGFRFESGKGFSHGQGWITHAYDDGTTLSARGPLVDDVLSKEFV